MSAVFQIILFFLLSKSAYAGAVVTANPLATKVGMDILRKGGNVVDAAVGVQYVLGLVEPQSSGLGGGSFSIFYHKKSDEILRELIEIHKKSIDIHQNTHEIHKKTYELHRKSIEVHKETYALHRKSDGNPMKTIGNPVESIGNRGQNH